MGLRRRLKAFFGVTAAAQPAAIATEEYKGFLITPAPIKKGNLYLAAATISKGDKSHALIRADEIGNFQECCALSLRKARLMIDQQGDELF
ncbi:MAG: HlyU family transcriptional regulator [Motiliproteus sp.]